MSAVLLLLVGLAALSLAHELGHAVAARGLGLHVTDVCIGLGPPLLRFERRGVRWMIAPIPLGGFVRVAELAPEFSDAPAAAKAWFSHRSLAKRIAVVCGGPAANYGVATLVAWVLAVGWGIETGRAEGLKVVLVDESTMKTGLAVGDVVSQVNGQKVEDLRSLSRALANGDPDGVAMVRLHRGGLPLDLRVPRLRARSGAWGLGAAYVIEPELRQLGSFVGLFYALAAPIREARAMLVHAASSVISRRSATARPLGVVGLADRVYAIRSWTPWRILTLTISLSVAMGLFNLLPLPGLDGGRLCIEVAQALRRRRLPTRALVAIQIVGGLILLAAWILLTAFEIYRR